MAAISSDRSRLRRPPPNLANLGKPRQRSASQVTSDRSRLQKPPGGNAQVKQAVFNPHHRQQLTRDLMARSKGQQSSADRDLKRSLLDQGVTNAGDRNLQDPRGSRPVPGFAQPAINNAASSGSGPRPLPAGMQGGGIQPFSDRNLQRPIDAALGDRGLVDPRTQTPPDRNLQRPSGPRPVPDFAQPAERPVPDFAQPTPRPVPSFAQPGQPNGTPPVAPGDRGLQDPRNGTPQQPFPGASPVNGTPQQPFPGQQPAPTAPPGVDPFTGLPTAPPTNGTPPLPPSERFEPERGNIDPITGLPAFEPDRALPRPVPDFAQGDRGLQDPRPAEAQQATEIQNAQTFDFTTPEARTQFGQQQVVAAEDPLQAALQQRLLSDVGQTGEDPETAFLRAQFEQNVGKERNQLVEDLQRFGVIGGGASAGASADVLGEFAGQTNLGRLNVDALGAQLGGRNLDRAIAFQENQANRGLREGELTGNLRGTQTLGAQALEGQQGLALGDQSLRRQGLEAELGLGSRALDIQQAGVEEDLARSLQEREQGKTLFGERVGAQERFGLEQELGRGALDVSRDALSEAEAARVAQQRLQAGELTGELDGQSTLGQRALNEAEAARVEQQRLQSRELSDISNRFGQGLGLERERLGQQGSQFDRSLAEQEAARLEAQRLQSRELSDVSSRFGQSLEEQRRATQAQEALAQSQLGQQGSQFDRSLAEQEAARLEAQRLQSRELGDISNRFRQGQQLERERLAQQGGQFEAQLGQQSSQFDRSMSEQEAARLESQRLQSRELSDISNRFRQGQGLERERMAQQGSQFEAQLGQQGSQFDRAFGLDERGFEAGRGDIARQQDLDTLAQVLAARESPAPGDDIEKALSFNLKNDAMRDALGFDVPPPPPPAEDHTLKVDNTFVDNNDTVSTEDDRRYNALGQRVGKGVVGAPVIDQAPARPVVDQSPIDRALGDRGLQDPRGNQNKQAFDALRAKINQPGYRPTPAEIAEFRRLANLV